MDLEFESVKKCIFRTLEQAGTNICSMGYQNSNFKIVPSLYGCALKYTEQSTHCAMWILLEVEHWILRYSKSGRSTQGGSHGRDSDNGPWFARDRV